MLATVNTPKGAACDFSDYSVIANLLADVGIFVFHRVLERTQEIKVKEWIVPRSPPL